MRLDTRVKMSVESSHGVVSNDFQFRQYIATALLPSIVSWAYCYHYLL